MEISRDMDGYKNMTNCLLKVRMSGWPKKYWKNISTQKKKKKNVTT